TNILFEPDLTREYSINIYNTDNKAFEATLELEGQLAEYILLESQTVTFEETTRSQKVYFNVSFPRDVPPGDYSGILNIVEKPVSGEGIVSASVGVTHKISLTVPKHGKYIRETIEQEEDSLIVTIENIGIREIEKLELLGNIHDKNKEYLYDAIKENLESDELFTKIVSFEMPPGKYNHNLLIHYDEGFKNLTNILTIGKIELDITNLEIGEFTFGGIAPIKVSLASNWNEEIILQIILEVWQKEQSVAIIKGPDTNILDEATTTVFWETAGLTEGNYDLRLKVLHNDNTLSAKEYNIKLSEKGIKIQNKFKTIITITLALIIIIAIVIILLLLKRKKKSLQTKKFK
ncbi:MAG: hypothetical protein ABIB43_01385, partial [archaeon]